MPSLSKKERNTKFNTNDVIFGKKIYLPSRTLLSAESLANKSNIPKIPFSLVPSKKYIMIKKFKDKLKILKNILNEIKNLRLLREQDINEIKKWNKRKVKYVRQWNKQYIRKVRCRFNNFNNKM